MVHNMNILFISTEIPYPPDHGHHISTYNSLKGLAKNHNIFFVGFATTKKELKYKRAIKPLCVSADIFMIASGWRFWLSLFFNVFSPRPFIGQRYYKSAARKTIRNLLREDKIDFVHFDLLHVAPYYKVVRALPKVLGNRNVESLRFLRRLQTERNIIKVVYFYLQYFKLRRFEKKMPAKFDCCVLVSDVDKRFHARLTGNDNFVVIPNGVEIDYFTPNGIPHKSNTLVWVGSMKDPYNADAVDYFLENILPRIKTEIPDVEVNFVGASPTKLLKRKASENEHLKISGFVDDVRPHMEQATVFIAPIRCGSGTKIKILNALSMSMPVVTTPVGAEGIAVVDDENIIIAKDDEDFANKTIMLLRNPEFAKNIGKNGRQLVEELYDWQAIHKQRHQLYAKIVHQRNAKLVKSSEN
ncbi:MAG: glycosyltransferase [Caldithrix sp.]|nr:MAG: glycosyltransferase [Caldithrix sp.]